MLLIFAGARAQPPAGRVPQTVPQTQGTTFSGAEVKLPESLNGKVSVLVLGFSEASRDTVGGWGHRLAADFSGSPAVQYYEMPVVAAVPRLMRSFVLGRIKASVSERGRRTFLPVTDHEAEWKALAGYSKSDDAYILLVDPSGDVVWRTQGPATDPAYSELMRRIAVLRTGPPAR